LKRIFFTSVFYLVFGLLFGVFYREYTRMMDFRGETALSFVHPHILTLGFTFFLVVLVLDKIFKVTSQNKYKVFFILYNIGLIISIFAMIYRGILDVLNLDQPLVPYIAGAGHMVIAAGFGFFLRVLFLSLKNKTPL